MGVLDRIARRLDRRAVMRPGRQVKGEWWPTRHGTVRVIDRGHGPAVLLAPDPPNGLEHLEALMAELAVRHRVIAFEPPGFGWSSVAKGYEWSLDHTADVIEDVLDRAQVDRAVLALPCVLGLAAIRYAERRSPRADRVAGLVLSQTVAWPEARAWLRRIDRRAVLRTPVAGQVMMRLQEPTIRDRWYRAAEPDEARRVRYTELADGRARQGARFPLASALQQVRGPDPFQAPIPLPAVLLWGDRDRSHGREHAASLQRVLPRMTIRFVPGAGHFPDLSAPEEVRHAVSQLWAQAVPGQDTKENRTG